MNLADKYRPGTLDGIIGQPEAVETIRTLANRGLGGRAYWISGKSGHGKTTLARVIAGMIADDLYIEEVDGGKLTPDRLRDWDYSAHTYAGGKGGRAFIINESHGLRKDIIRSLLVLLEDIPEHVAWIFTTTSEAQADLFDDKVDAGPLLSRCIRIQLAIRSCSDAFAARAREIAELEDLPAKAEPIEAYKKLLQNVKNNFREALQYIEAGNLKGPKQ